MLTYPVRSPPVGSTQVVVPGILWIRMPLQDGLNYVNVWALEDGDGWTVVDTGIRSDEATAAWQHIFATDLGGRAITRVIATHFHEDHIGLAGWLQDQQGSTLWMTLAEYLLGRKHIADGFGGMPCEESRFYMRAGWTLSQIGAYEHHFKRFARTVHSIPESFRRVRDSDVLTIGGNLWNVVVGGGHSPDALGLYCGRRQILIAGDEVLPRISANISVYAFEPSCDPISDALRYWGRLQSSVPASVLVLPSHNEPFYGLHERLDEMAMHRRETASRLRLALDTPRRAVDLLGFLFRRPVHNDPVRLWLATGESLAYLRYLENAGEITSWINDDDQTVYAAA